MRPYLEKTLHKKRTCGVAQVVGTELNSSTTKKKKKKKKKGCWIGVVTQMVECLLHKCKCLSLNLTTTKDKKGKKKK
jgi:hypothetical protein